MKAIGVTLSILLLLPSLPAHADFQYTHTSKVTGGSLYGTMKFAAHFSKKGQNPLDPEVTTYYVKGNRLRTDNPDGKTLIIDLEGKRVIGFDSRTKTYSVATFDEIRAATEQARERMQQQEQQQAPQGQGPKPQDAQITVKPKIQIMPGAGTRVILGQPTNETTMQMDMEIQAQNNGQNPSEPASGDSGLAPGQTASGTMTMNIDMYVAPSVHGFAEIGEFYRRMAEELDWVPPSSIHVDPRFSQGMSELQKNSAELRGLPMLETVSMGMSVPPGQEQDSGNGSAANPPRQTSAPPPSDTPPTTPSGVAVKALGGLFGRKKQQQQDAPPPAQSETAQAGPDQSSASTGKSISLLEMTIEVTSFSDSSIDAGVFDIPSGYTEVKESPDQVLSGGGPRA